jgi:hypothetical protein
MRGNHARPDRIPSLEHDVDNTDFADECEAFLAGRWAETREDTTRPLPMWAWLNPIAHGDLEQVRALAAVVDPPSGPERLQAAVAQAVLGALPATELPRVQREVLVPLELRLLGSPTSPRHVLELITDALY